MTYKDVNEFMGRVMSNLDGEMDAEIERLRSRVRDAEIALGVWDPSSSSEYWLRYPSRIPQENVTEQGNG
jgi:hypothetical protein